MQRTHSLLRYIIVPICLLYFSVNIAFAQNNANVEGIITNNTTGIPVGFVTVTAKNTNTNRTYQDVADSSGKFYFANLPVEGSYSFEFSSVGYISRTISGYILQPGQINNIVVSLEESASALNDVVVIGYGTVQRKDVTTAVSTVSLEDLTERPVVSAAQAIQGKAPGVQVTQPSGQPGGSMVVRIRGNTSITASNDPLYVVDGVPTDDINFLSPNDIASMQILKDASSAAIYGSRAANGVVLITTKEGVRGNPKIGINSYVGYSKVIKQMNSLNVVDYKDLMDDLGIIHLPDGLTDRTNWFDETFRNGKDQNYQLSLSSGNDKMRYFISGGYTNQKGIIDISYYKRYNFRANIENKIKEWMKITSNIAYSDYSGNGIISGTGASRAGVILSVINTPTYAPIWDASHPGQYYNNFYGANITHPVENMSRTADNKDNHNRLLASVSAELSLFSGFKFKSSNTLDRVYYHSTTFLDPLKTTYGRTEGGNASDNRSLSTIFTFDNIFTFDKKLGDHSFNIVGGTSYTTSKWTNSYIGGAFYRTGYTPKTLDAANRINPYSTGTSESEWALMSYIGRVSYNYKSKYLVTANLRSDGSSKLSPDHRYGFFPSVSAAWRISAEEFMSNATWINDLKLRGGWGKTGNQSGISDYAYLQMYSIQRIDWWIAGNERSVVNINPSNMRNRDLTWETTIQSNIGLDLTVLNNRLTLNADAYYKHTKNLLMNVPLPSGLEFGNIFRNEGEMENKGIEFGIQSKNISNEKLTWETDFNMSFNRNKVTNLALQKIYYYASTTEVTSENVVRMTVGQPLGMFWGYISEGVDPESGDIVYRDLDGNGRITTSDKTYIGNPNPKFTWGMTNTLNYKGFNLNIFIQGSQGNDIYNASRYETEGMYNANNQSTEVLRRWQIPGQITDIPRASQGTDNLRASTRFVEDGSYARLKSLTLSYDIKAKILEKWKVSRLQPYVTAQNLFTITNYTGFDPEVNQYGGSATVQGIDWGTYPQVKTFVVGINIDF